VGFVKCDILRIREVLLWTSELFVAKIFFEIYGVSARTRGVEPVRTFYEQGGGEVNFLRFCTDTLN